MSQFLSPEAARLAPYTPGEQPRDQQYIKLNTNESPFPPSPAVAAAVAGADAQALQLYSDPTCAALHRAIARYYGVEEENVLAGNGSDEILAFAFRAFCGTGRPADRERVVVVDEAYVDFGAESCVPLIGEYDNLLVVQTMSKSRSLAGGRVGFAIGCPSLIEDLNRVKYSFNPYNVNRMSMAAAAAAMEDKDYFARCCAAIRENRAWTASALEALGFSVLPSAANFLFAKHPRLEGQALYQALKARGILVRWFDGPRTRDFVRITVGSRPQMEALAAAVRDILA